MKDNKYKDVKTTELLDFVSKDIPYTKDKEMDKRTDFKNELENREPFRDIKMKIDRMNRQIKDLNEAVSKLLDHKHDQQGSVTIPVEKSMDRIW